MCSAIDPRNKEPLCEGDCGQPAVSGLERCAECHARLCLDQDHPEGARALVEDGLLSAERFEQIVRETVDYVTWARRQNAAAVGRMGHG